MDVVVDSVWLWVVTGCALWALLGLLAASGFGIPPAIGALVGAVGWFFGVFALLVVGVIRAGGRRAGTQPPSGVRFVPPAPAVDPFAAMFAGPPGSFGVPGGPYTPAGRGRSGPASGQPGSTGEWALLGVGLASAACMAVSVALTWGSFAASWHGGTGSVHGGLAPMDLGVTAVLVLATAVLLGAGAYLHRRWPRGAWVAVAVLPATLWFTLISQVLVVGSGLQSLTGKVDYAAGGRVSGTLHTAPGLWLMYAGTIGAFVWAVSAALRLVRSRGGMDTPVTTSRPVDQSLLWT